MADGSHIVKVDGVSLRAFSAEKVEEFANRKDELAVCKENEGRNLQRLELAAKDVKIAEQQTAIERQRFAGAMALYEKERELRVQSMQFLPHGKVGGFGGKVLNFLDGFWGQAAFKLVIPTAQAVKVFTQ